MSDFEERRVKKETIEQKRNSVQRIQSSSKTRTKWKSSNRSRKKSKWANTLETVVSINSEETISRIKDKAITRRPNFMFTKA